PRLRLQLSSWFPLRRVAFPAKAVREPRSTVQLAVRGRVLRVGLQDCFDLECDLNFVAEADTAGVGDAELDVEVAAVDLGTGGEPDPRVAEGRRLQDALEL